MSIDITEQRSRWAEKVFIGVCITAVAVPLIMLAALMIDVASDAVGRLGWDFITGMPSRKAEQAGILPALVGSLYLIGLTAAFALPLGIGAAIYLEEYGGRSRFSTIIEINIANLAGVPSVIYGLLGLGVFVRFMGLGRSIVAGALTLALLVMPIIIMATREALRTVPKHYREASLALGATQWQTVRKVVLPVALPGVLTGAILSISRAIGETAPLIVVGALTFMPFLPKSPTDEFTALPIQIYNWVSRPQESFVVNAAAGIVVLLISMLLLNSIAIVVRNRLQKRLG